MCSVHSLSIVRRVPIVVICLSAVVTETVPQYFGPAGGREGRLTEDDGIGCCQIDTQSTSSGREAEHEYIGTGHQLNPTNALPVSRCDSSKERQAAERQTTGVACFGPLTHFVCQAVTISLL